MPNTIPKRTKRKAKAAAARPSIFAVQYEDGRQVTYDPNLPLAPGCDVVVLYPVKRKGEGQARVMVSGIGTLESPSPKRTGIVWVTFPMEDGRERRSRIDQDKGHVVARVTGILTPLPIRDDPKLERRARS